MAAWKGTEKKLVLENYNAPGRGPRWCQQQLGRSKSSVQAFAMRNGLAKKALPARKSTPQIDEVIKRAYASGEQGAVRRCAESIGAPTTWVCKRALALGLTTRPVGYAPLTEEERTFINDHAHLSSLKISAMMRERGWARTSGSVAKHRRLKCLRLGKDTVFPAQDIALFFGVSISTVHSWIRAGLLHAQRRGIDRGHYLVDEFEIARFVVGYPSRVPFRTLDGDWFVSLMVRHAPRAAGYAGRTSDRLVGLVRERSDLTLEEIAVRAGASLKAVQKASSQVNRERRAA